MALIRNLAFYAAFYLGTLLRVTMVLLAVPFGPARVRAVVRGWSRSHRWCARVLLGIDLRIEGVRPTAPVFYAMRHESFLEAIELPAILDQPVIFAKEELFRLPGWGPAALAYGLIPVARDQGAKALRAMIVAARAAADEGRPVVIFPEGTRVPHGREAPLQSGFAAIYKLLRLPVVPVAIDSGPLYHRRWKRAGTITLRFGEPIPAGLARAEVEARVLAGINALNG